MTEARLAGRVRCWRRGFDRNVGVQRLFETSSGWVLFDLTAYPGTPFAVSVTPFSADGWEGEGKTWMGEQESEVALDGFLQARLGVPPDEAKALAEAIQGPWQMEWERSGGRDYARKLARASFGVFGLFAVGAVLAVIGAVLVIWLLAT
jgi:hypothetical protein